MEPVLETKTFKLILDLDIFQIKLYGHKKYIQFPNILIFDLMLFMKDCHPRINKIKSKQIISISNINYRVVNIVHQKTFSKFLPHIPLISLDQTILNLDFIRYGDKILGICNDSTTIIPMCFIINIIMNFIKNSSFYFFPNDITFDICETLNSDSKIKYYAIVKDKIAFKHLKTSYILNPGDMIFNINSTRFNINGHIYSERYKMYLTINTYILLHGINTLTISYTSNKKLLNIEKTDKSYDRLVDILDDYNVNIDVKHKQFISAEPKLITIDLKPFDNDKLRIPIINRKKITYNDLEFKILSESLINSTKINISEQLFGNKFVNSHSNKQTVITEINKTIYRLQKISNKNIWNLNDLEIIINKREAKRTFTLQNIETNELLKVIV